MDNTIEAKSFPSFQQLLCEEPIIILENPKTDNYKILKEKILSENFPWFYSEYTTDDVSDVLYESKTTEEYRNIPFFTHCLVERPSSVFPVSKVTSYDIQLYTECINEIAKHNEFRINVIYRMNVNRTIYNGSSLYTMPHVDHDFPHNNLLIYLTEVTGGEIKVYKNEKWHIYKPLEDEIVMFNGLHCHKTAQKPNEHRVAIVTTFI